MITDESEIPGLVNEINVRMRELQDYVKDRNIKESRIEFPRGYLRSCEHHKKKYEFLQKPIIEKNISYTLLATDVYRWLLNRTDIALSAQEMIVKQGLILICSVVEVLVEECLKGLHDRGKFFKQRLRTLSRHRQLDKKLAEELEWLWDVRNNIHLAVPKKPEHNKYAVKDYNRAIRGLTAIVEAFNGATEK